MGDWFSLGGSVLGTAANIGSTLINNAHQERLQQQAQDWNANQTNIAWQRSVEQWQRENEYNSPTAQMQRLREAGINPALAYASGVFNQAATSPDAPVPAPARAAPTQAWQVDPLLAAQVANLDAQTRNLDSHTTYQQFMNQVEEALAHSPISKVSVTSPDGSEDVKIEYGNVRVEFAKRELKSIGLENQFNNATLNDLLFDLALLSDTDWYGNSPAGSTAPSETPGFVYAKRALRGDQNVRDVASQMANLAKEAAEAEKAGRKAYAEWLRKHEDEPIVKFMLGLQGFVQTLGISIPSFGGSSNSTFRGPRGTFSRTGKQWFFGGIR